MATQFQNIPDYSKLDISLPCNTDVSGLQYKAVKLSSAEIVAAGSGDQAIGILQNAPDGSSSSTSTNRGPIASVRCVGMSKYFAGAGVTSGQLLKPNTDGSGTLIPIASDKDKAIAMAVGDTDSGNIGICVLCPSGASI